MNLLIYAWSPSACAEYSDRIGPKLISDFHEIRMRFSPSLCDLLEVDRLV